MSLQVDFLLKPFEAYNRRCFRIRLLKEHFNVYFCFRRRLIVNYAATYISVDRQLQMASSPTLSLENEGKHRVRIKGEGGGKALFNLV